MSKKKQPEKKAGDKMKGYFEAGEVVTTQETKPKTLVTSTMLPRSNPNSYWNTQSGKKRIEEMKKIMKKNKGKLVKA